MAATDQPQVRVHNPRGGHPGQQGHAAFLAAVYVLALAGLGAAAVLVSTAVGHGWERYAVAAAAAAGLGAPIAAAASVSRSGQLPDLPVDEPTVEPGGAATEAGPPDELTGLIRRPDFLRDLGALARMQPILALAVADVDHLAGLNDAYGHETGDRIIRLVARTLRESLRGADIVCRYEGGRFAVALPACPAPDAARALEAVRSRLDAAVTVSDLPLFTCSFGVVQRRDAEDAHAAMARAHAALEAAKRQGRDRISIEQHPAGGGPPTPVLRTRELIDPLEAVDAPPLIIDTTDTDDGDA